MARPGCGGGCACVLAGSDCIDVLGSGSVADPFVILPIVAPGDNALECTADGAAVLVSADAGNALTYGSDGRLYTNGTPVGGLGTMAFQDADAVAIVGGTIEGIPITSRTAAGAADQLVLADVGKVVRYTNAGAVACTVPDDGTVAWPLGAVIAVYAAGAGGVTLTPGVGVTIRNNTAALSQYQEISIRRDGANEWVRVG